MAKVVLIGAGRMGYRFSLAVRAASHELELIFDPSENPWAMQQEQDLVLKHTRNFEEVLASDADLYVICTTADLHISIATRLLEEGKRALVIEKPLCQSVQEGIDLRKLAIARGARVVVNHGRRYSSNTAAIKALDGDPRTGELRSIVIKMGGGSFGCVGTHWIDLCNNLMQSAPNCIFGTLSEFTPPNVRGSNFFDPGGTAILLYPGGKRAIIDLGDDIGIVAGAEFIFEKGSVTWTTEGGNWTLRHRRAEDQDNPLTMYALPLIEDSFPTTPPDLIEYAMATIEDALCANDIKSGLDEAIVTMEVFAAIRCSARDGCCVSLPLLDVERQRVYPIP